MIELSRRGSPSARFFIYIYIFLWGGGGKEASESTSTISSLSPVDYILLRLCSKVPWLCILSRFLFSLDSRQTLTSRRCVSKHFVPSKAIARRSTILKKPWPRCSLNCKRLWFLRSQRMILLTLRRPMIKILCATPLPGRPP
jgi:hypothetical protein